jgi:uncharacterized protein YjiS (DUF1127 family)
MPEPPFRDPSSSQETVMEFAFLKRFLAERRVYRRVVQELSFCTDRELRELGFERVDIPRIARRAAEETRAA